MPGPVRLDAEKFRFLIAGVTTTAFSYLLYLVLLRVLSPMVAYALAYVAGIVWGYTVNSLWVFRGRWTWTGLFAYPLVYALQAAAALVAFAVVVRLFGWPAQVAPLIVIVAMLPVSFLLGRRIVYHTSMRGMGRESPDSVSQQGHR